MAGGLMQLVAYGAQDIYLTGNPQITFFKMIYRRHTNFSTESIEQSITGDVEIGGTVTAIISRNGDLLHRIYLDLSYASNACRYPNAFASIDQMELMIGGQSIDIHYGDWMHTWAELTTSGDKSILLNEMIQCNTLNRTATIPLQFWFCRNPGLALPLIALQYHEVKLKITFSAASSGSETLSNANTKLWCEYIYLDTDERRRFAQIPHEYLIEQTQRVHNDTIASGYTDSIYSASLSIHHPIKELIWYIQNTNLTDESRFNFKRYEGTLTQVSSEYDQISTGQLKLNGHNRHATRNAEHFRLTQRYEHHSGVGMKNQGTHDTSREHTFTSVSNNLTDDSGAIYSASALATYTHGTVFLNDATGQSAVDGTTLNVDLAEGCIIQFSAGSTQLLTLTRDYRRTEQSVVGMSGAVAIATSHTITNIQIPYVNLNHILSDFDADLIQIGDVLVVTPTAATYDSHISDATNASAQTITITADNFDMDTGRLTLTTTIYILAAMFDNTNSAAIAVTLRNKIHGSKIVSDMSWIYCYSFALAPEEHQPSGTCNFSRIDSAHLHLGLNTAKNASGSAVNREIKIYATNYNVLRIMSGMGGLAYDN
jgi:hypothetical protein